MGPAPVGPDGPGHGPDGHVQRRGPADVVQQQRRSADDHGCQDVQPRRVLQAVGDRVEKQHPVPAVQQSQLPVRASRPDRVLLSPAADTRPLWDRHLGRLPRRILLQVRQAFPPKFFILEVCGLN